MNRITLSILLLLCLVLPCIAQQKRNRRPKRKVEAKPQAPANRPPVIKSLTTSSSKAIIPCPRWVAGTYVQDRLTLEVITNAFDPEGDALSYQYLVTGGQIIGEGYKVIWDLTGAEPGPQEIKVFVSDKQTSWAPAAVNLSVSEPLHCEAPCATLDISGPVEADEGQSITFTANIAGGEPSVEPTFNWTISAGSIIKGQGTPTIEVDTTGLAEQQLTATLEIDGYPPECTRTTTFQVQVRNKH